MAEVKLHGFWYSPFTLRVVWTLKFKGIAYENIEEDRYNKSAQLLEYNPVYKKTPVLVHGGKPLPESMIIVEYIDEVWPHNPLLPSHPYDRALARFWAKYADDTVPAANALFRSSRGEEREKAIEKLWEHLIVVEEHCFIERKKFFGGDTINVVDIAFGALAEYVANLEVIIDVKVLEAEKFPQFLSWFNSFKNVPVIRENTPDREKIIAASKSIIQKALASS